MSSIFLVLAQKFRREVSPTRSGPTAVTNQTGILEKLVNWIADADEAIQSMYFDWQFMWAQFSASTVAGTKDVTKPSDLGIWDTDSFYLDRTLTTYKKLTEYDYFKWRTNLRNGPKTNDKPTYFIIGPDDNIILESPPDAIYTLTADYYKTPTRLAANTDTSPIPSRFERIIIAKAKIYYGQDQGAPDLVAAGMNEYRELLQRMEAQYLRGQKARMKGTDENMVVVPE